MHKPNADTPATLAGFKIGAHYIVWVSPQCNRYYEAGDRVRFMQDDGSTNPRFWNYRINDDCFITLTKLKPAKALEMAQELFSEVCDA